MVDGYQRFCRFNKSLSMMPCIIVNKRRQLIEENDPISQFLREKLEENEDGSISTSELCRHYNAWCGDNNYRNACKSPVGFGKILSKRYGKLVCHTKKGSILTNFALIYR